MTSQNLNSRAAPRGPCGDTARPGREVFPSEVLVTPQICAMGGTDAVFVDWLSLAQSHPQGGLPVFTAGVVWGTDEEGEVDWRTVRARKIEGSYETSLQVRCDGETVTFSGNISRFGRPDNLFGFSFPECLRRINLVLAHFYLPPFTTGEKYHANIKTKEGWTLKRCWTGAVVRKIDLTRNYESGSADDARRYMEWLATQQGGARVQVGTYTGGETVDWGRGSRSVYYKVYLKGPEIRRHKGPDALADYCDSVGLCRFEVSFKSTWLHDYGMHYLGDLDMGELIKAFEHRAEVLTRAKHTSDDFEQLPNHYRRTARDYLAGDDMSNRLSRRTFYRHRKALLPYGIDIAVKRNVINFQPRVRVVEVRPARIPSWYDFGNRKAA